MGQTNIQFCTITKKKEEPVSNNTEKFKTNNSNVKVNKKLNSFIHDNIKQTIGVRQYLYYFHNIAFGTIGKNALAIIGEDRDVIDIIYNKYSDKLDKLIKKNWPNAKVALRYFILQNDKLNEINFTCEFLEKPKSKVIFFNEIGNKYTFDNFVASEENINVLEICQSLACYSCKELVSSGSIVCIYGSSSTGKTHLINAVENFYRKNDGKVFNITANGFLQKYVESIQKHDVFNFQNSILSNEIIIIDDVDDLIGKNGTLMELKKILSMAVENKKYIILTMSLAPKQLSDKSGHLNDIITNAISWGIKEPKEALKIQILMNYICEKNLNVPISIVKDLVRNLNCTVRELKNYIKKLSIVQSIRKFELNTNLALSILADDVKKQNDKLTISNEEILSIVAEYYNLSVNDLISKIKRENVCKARNIAMHLMKKINSLNFQEIGRILNRNHATIIIGLRKVETWIQNDKKIPAELADLMMKIKNRNHSNNCSECIN